jgi:hypothetical protein
MTLKDEFTVFVKELWRAVRSIPIDAADPSDIAMQLGLRAFRLHSGVERPCTLLTEPNEVLSQLQSAVARSPLIPTGTNSDGGLKSDTHANIALGKTASYMRAWKGSMPAPLPKTAPDPTPEAQPTLLQVQRCSICGNVCRWDARFVEDNKVGECCGDRVVGMQTRTPVIP